MLIRNTEIMQKIKTSLNLESLIQFSALARTWKSKKICSTYAVVNLQFISSVTKEVNVMH